MKVYKSIWVHKNELYVVQYLGEHSTQHKEILNWGFISSLTRGFLTRSQRGILSNYQFAPNGRWSVEHEARITQTPIFPSYYTLRYLISDLSCCHPISVPLAQLSSHQSVHILFAKYWEVTAEVLSCASETKKKLGDIMHKHLQNTIFQLFVMGIEIVNIAGKITVFYEIPKNQSHYFSFNTGFG